MAPSIRTARRFRRGPDAPDPRSYEPDLKGFVAHARWLLANGCDGLAPLGTTGEANSLSLGQRMKIIEMVATELPAGKCIIGAGACALADAVHLTREIVRMGAAGALILPPFYYKSPGEDGLYGFFSEVIERVGDARLRLYLYHFPQLSAVPITLTLIERLKKTHGDAIAGLKDSGGDWNYSDALLKALPGFGVFSGSEQYLLNNLRAGGVGTISASVNVTAPLAQAGLPRLAEARGRQLAKDAHRGAGAVPGLSAGGGAQGDHGADFRQRRMAQHPAA